MTDEYLQRHGDAKYEGLGENGRAWQMLQDGIDVGQYQAWNAAEHEAGLVRGVHFLDRGDELKQLKREGRLTEALELVIEIIEATEREQDVKLRLRPSRFEYWSNLGVEGGSYVGPTPPGWTIHAAIILRKLKAYEAEVAIIDRWLARAENREYPEMMKRRAKAFELLKKSRG